MTELWWSTLVADHTLPANIVVMVGAAVQASVGFGFALIAVPLLVLLDTAYAPGPTLLASLLLAAIMTQRGRHEINSGQLLTGASGLLIGAGTGALLLPMIPVAQLPFLFGGAILFAVGLSLTGLKVPVTTSSLLSVATVAGVMGTMAGIHGPPLALLYQREGADKIRAMLAVFFLIGYSLSLLALGWVQIFGMRELAMGCSLMPGVAIGYILSRLFAGVLKNASLRGPILLVASVSAFSLLVRG
ncbi:MAG: sulfite exporter TauE/SafE family protein [Desulfobacterales bacterium]|jgi:hypothetical protein|nr:sulfite exporter TauE/SafE family protein [Desulfobacterales bacterium]